MAVNNVNSPFRPSSQRLGTSAPTLTANVARRVPSTAGNARRRIIIPVGLGPFGSTTGDSNDEVVASGDITPAIESGTLLEVKRLEVVYDAQKMTWVEEESQIGPDARDKKGRFAEYAFVLRRTKHPSKDTSQLYIQSKYLKKVGATVMEHVHGVSWTVEPLAVDSDLFISFLPLLQEHADILRLQTDRTEEETTELSHLDFLLTFIRSEFSSTIAQLDSLLSHGEITFDLLWAILVPRTIFYMTCPVTREPRAILLTEANLNTPTPGRPRWILQGCSVEHNKDYQAGVSKMSPQFGYADVRMPIISHFKGAVKIKNLPSHPIEYHVGVDKLKERLVERGRKWVSLQGTHHMYYKGIATAKAEAARTSTKAGGPNGTVMMAQMGIGSADTKITVDGRIMLDQKTMQEMIPNYAFPLVTMNLNMEPLDEMDDHSKENPSIETEAVFPPINDTHLLLASPILYGFSLEDKQWLEFNVIHVSSFKWSEEPFDNLVLPAKMKDLVKALVDSHRTSGAGFDDFVKGKGRGLIFNLFGNPGVGKTLTAEATSEHLKRPLYVVGAGELGTNALTLDANLKKIFEPSAKWNAVVLIDEADVFLEERSLHDLERNAFVAVFLRHLEYFRGILLLTTNRVRTFDEAFRSRIHISLHYQDLTPEAKQGIWVAFLKKARAESGAGIFTENAGLSDVELADLGQRMVNGRQIKNVVKTACALSSSRNEVVGYEHLIQVLETLEQFDADWKASQNV